MNKYISAFNNGFAETDDLNSVAEFINLDMNYDHGGVLLWSDAKNAYIDVSDSHSIVFGGSGCKKTRSINFELPIISANANNQESFIVTDAKGEIYAKTHTYMQKKGYKVYVLNFREPETGNRFNPFKIPCELYKSGKIDKSNIYIRDIAKQVYTDLSSNTNDSYWTNASEDYFTGLAQLTMLITNGDLLTMESLMLLHQYVAEGQMQTDMLKSYLRTLPSNSEIIPNINATIDNASDTRKCIFGVFTQPLALYNQEAIKDMMCESDFDITDFAREPSVLYIITPDERTVYNSIVAMFIKQSYSMLVDYAATSPECKNFMLPIRVNYLLDEFSNLPKINDMDAMISASRSRNIRFTLTVQSLAQLRHTYTAETAENIINNCSNWIVMRSNDRELHKMIEELSGSITTKYSQMTRPLIQGNSIRQFNKGQALLLIAGLNPIVFQYPDIDDYNFNLPNEYANDFKNRDKCRRKFFNYEQFFKDNKKKQLFELMNKPKSQKELQKDKPFDIDIDALVKQIDDKLAKMPDIIPNADINMPRKNTDILIIDSGLLDDTEFVDFLSELTTLKNERYIEYFNSLPIMLTYSDAKNAAKAAERLDELGVNYEYDGD